MQTLCLAGCEATGASTITIWTPITALATIVLVIITGIYVILVNKQLKQMRRQVDMLAGQNNERARLAINAIVKEIRANHLIANSEAPALFSDYTYAASLWTFSEASILPETECAITDACLSVKHSNAYHDPSLLGYDIRAKAYGDAVRDLQVAVDAIAEDSRLLEWLERANIE